MGKLKNKWHKFSKNEDLSLTFLTIKIFFLFISLVGLIYIVIGLAKLYLTADNKEDFLFQRTLWELVCTAIVSLIIFIISSLSTFKNKKETKLVSRFIKNSIIPILALGIIFFGTEKTHVIKESILLTGISEEDLINGTVFNNILQGTIFLIAPSVLTIIYNIRMFLFKLEESKEDVVLVTTTTTTTTTSKSKFEMVEEEKNVDKKKYKINKDKRLKRPIA